MFLNQPGKRARLLRRMLMVCAMCGVLGSWMSMPDPAPDRQAAVGHHDGLSAATDGSSAQQESKPADKSNAAGESRAPRSSKPHEKPRRKKSLELGIGEEPGYARRLPA
jgi:hypothetical protein